MRRGLLLALARVESRLTAVRPEVMATSDDVASAEGARDVAALLTHHTQGDHDYDTSRMPNGAVRFSRR